MNNIVYFVDKYTPQYENMLYMASKSAKIHMPNVKTVLQCATECEKAYKQSARLCIDEYVLFTKKYKPYAATRCMANILMTTENCLFVDIDTLFIASVEHVFEMMTAPCVLATLRWPKSHSPLLTLNFGVTWCNEPRFWLECVNEYTAIKSENRVLDDGELVPNNVFKDFVSKGTIKTAALPGEVFNHIVESPSQNVDKAAILHFKGDRKRFMPHFFLKYGYDVAKV